MSSGSVGKVAVGTGPCFLSMSFRKPGSDSSTRDWCVPTQTYSQTVVSQPFLHCSPVSSLVSFPLDCSVQSLAMLFSGRSFLQDMAAATVTCCRFPRSPALPPELLLAHCSGQEDGTTEPQRVRANLGQAPLGVHCLRWDLRESACVFSEAHHQ